MATTQLKKSSICVIKGVKCLANSRPELAHRIHKAFLEAFRIVDLGVGEASVRQFEFPMDNGKFTRMNG